MVKRLVKNADNDVAEAQNIISRVHEANDGLKQAYFVLFENLNALANGFPDIYNAIKKDIKLPETSDVREITNLYDDLTQVLPMFMDINYLKTYVGGEAQPQNGSVGENEMPPVSAKSKK